VQELREEVENWGGQARELQRVSRREVADLPPDTQVGFSITFWYGSGSADPCLLLLDPDWIRILLLLSLTFKAPTKK
jgi:hypothetical protein